MSLVNTEVLPFTATAYHDNDFVQVSDEDLRGQWAIFFFYPADFTFVCPTELGDLADHYEELKALGVEVYSVSTDTHFTHKAWHEVLRHHRQDPVPDGRRPHARHQPELRRAARRPRAWPTAAPS